MPIVGEKGLSGLFHVVDCDALSRRVAEQSETLEEIKRVFGKRFVADGSLDRRALAREVFSDKKKTETLNRIFHKKIFALLEEEIARSDGAVWKFSCLLPTGTGFSTACGW